MPDNKKTSILEIYDIETSERIILKEFENHIEAPNWTSDGKFLIYNSGGLIYKFDLETKENYKIDTGKCNRCNNDHVISADGKLLAISAGTNEHPESRIWVLPLSGGEPKLITKNAPSYLHGWSPDNSTLIYCANRNNDYDVYAINVNGGEEIRLTDAPGLDDGPEYSPDGKYIWFNSVRSGLMQVWCMKSDGSEQIQFTFCKNFNNWFPHISPDNKKVVFISYYANEVSPNDHPQNKNIEIRLMSSNGGEITSLFKAFGGQGTLNVNSWAPDSKRFAFVTYI